MYLICDGILFLAEDNKRNVISLAKQKENTQEIRGGFVNSFTLQSIRKKRNLINLLKE